jgi:hypothetical protein
MLKIKKGFLQRVVGELWNPATPGVYYNLQFFWQSAGRGVDTQAITEEMIE